MPIEIQEFDVLPGQPPPPAPGRAATGPAEKLPEIMRRWQAEQEVRCERMRAD
jgi:hypothetical protein